MSDSEESVQGFNLKQDNPKEWRRQYLEKYYERMQKIQQKEQIVYVLQCQDDAIYIGATHDLDKRFKEHKDRCGANFTRLYPPVSIIETYKTTWKNRLLLESEITKKYKGLYPDRKVSGGH